MNKEIIADKLPYMSKVRYKDNTTGNAVYYDINCHNGSGNMLEELTFNDVVELHQYCTEFIQEELLCRAERKKHKKRKPKKGGRK